MLEPTFVRSLTTASLTRKTVRKRSNARLGRNIVCQGEEYVSVKALNRCVSSPTYLAPPIEGDS